MKRTTVTLIMLVAAVAIVAAMAMPATARFYQPNKPVHMNSGFNNEKNGPGLFNANKVPENDLHLMNNYVPNGNCQPNLVPRSSNSNGNGNCNANVDGSTSIKKKVRPVIRIIGNKFPNIPVPL